jgi:hypothetical protein
MDPVLAQENIALTKKRNKAYEMNMHFEDTWAITLPWAKSIMGSNGKVVQVQCKVCFFIDGKDKLLVAKLDSLWKHARHHKALVTMLGVKGGGTLLLKI